jgi:hypothetical protein
MKVTRTFARSSILSAVTAAAILACAIPARSADGDELVGTWSGTLHDTSKDAKLQRSESLQPVTFEWVTTKFSLDTNLLRYDGRRSCTLRAQFVGRGSEGYEFVLKNPPGGHCDKADRAVLKREGEGLHLTVSSDDGETLHEEGTLQSDRKASAPIAH